MAKSEQPNSDEQPVLKFRAENDTDSPQGSLVKKLAMIITEMPAFKKTGWNAGQKFNFISIEQMKKEIVPRLAAEGIICYPYNARVNASVRERINDQGQVYGTSGELHLVTKWIITDGIETLFPHPETIGQALDVQDKSGSKGTTDALKNLYKTTFGVTEADEDNDYNTPVPRGESSRRAPAKQKRDLTDAQKEILQLKDQAKQIVVQLSEQQMCSTHDVVVQMIRDEVIPAEWEDPAKMIHRDDYKKFIAAAQEYIVVPELDGPSDEAAE